MDEKFNNIQSSLHAVMAKLGIPVERCVGAQSRGGHTCSNDTSKFNYQSHVSPLAWSASKEPTRKAVESDGAGDLPIVASPKTPSGS